jgi:hypothetical protein
MVMTTDMFVGEISTTIPAIECQRASPSYDTFSSEVQRSFRIYTANQLIASLVWLIRSKPR